MSATKENNNRTTIQSLDRGLALLEILSQSKDALGLPELATELEVDRSTIHRLLATLLARGFVVQDPISRKYTIGLKIIELSRRTIDGYNLRAASKPFIRYLVAETGESANLAVLSGKHAVCIDHETSPSPLAVTNDIGAVFKFHATALGKVILAFQPEENRKMLLEGYDYEIFTPRTITSDVMLENQLEKIHEKRYSLDDEERYLGVRCIAAPIFDYSEKIVAGIGIAAPTTRVTLESIEPLIKVVRKTAFDISVQLGYSPNNPHAD